MKIGFLGGTFDPVHNGHIRLAEAARDQLKLDKVYLVLSPRSPFKTSRSPFKNDREPVDATSRLEMLKRAIEGKKDLAVGVWELNRRGPSYTVTTLTNYNRENPSHKLYLIIGSDVSTNFHKWRQPEKILKLATLVIGLRPGHGLHLSNVEGNVLLLKGTFPEVSSTEIRRLLSRKKAPENLPLGTLSYIRTNHLYGC